MLLADVPAVLFGHVAGHRLNPRWVRIVAAAIFAALGISALAGYDFWAG
jgi:putative Ca2+/H+ antiporter (TMEM165/GDT1 family)